MFCAIKLYHLRLENESMTIYESPNPTPEIPQANIPSLNSFVEIFPNMHGVTDSDMIYGHLESAMRTYASYADVRVEESDEPFVDLASLQLVSSAQIGEDMAGESIFVREKVIEKLALASQTLQEILPGCRLQVVYGYRALSIQTRLFEQIRNEQLSSGFGGTEQELLEEVHRMVAVPDAAGHPTGGAVDLQIVDLDNQPLDFGTPIWNFERDSYVFSPFVEPVAWSNRMSLRGVMMDAGFAPFDGEWWHFSYGDKEWAASFNQPAAVYDQTEFSRPQ